MGANTGFDDRAGIGCAPSRALHGKNRRTVSANPATRCAGHGDVFNYDGRVRLASIPRRPFCRSPTTWVARFALCAWVEENIEETWTFYRQPREHHKHLKSTNLLERLNQEIKRRTHVVRIFPNEASCLRLIRALACEQHEEWLDGPVYLDMQPLRKALKPSLQLAA